MATERILRRLNARMRLEWLQVDKAEGIHIDKSVPREAKSDGFRLNPCWIGSS